jgi:hypothetical protein
MCDGEHRITECPQIKAMESQLKESLEDLATKVETGLEHSRNVEKLLKESIAEINSTLHRLAGKYEAED